VPERAVLIPCLHDEPFARLALVRAAFQAARGYVFNTAPEARLAETLFGLAQRPAGVVGLGFDLPPPTEPAAFRRRHGLTGPIVLYLGRKETGKNVPMLIHYFQRYRETRRSDVTLVLAGDGPVTAPRGAPGIRDLGYLEPGDKAAAYAAATVVCQPSVNESFSIVLMEAWVAERPVLVHARCPVTTEHVMRSSGGLPFADYFEFAEALTLLLEDEACRRKLGAQGRRYVATEFAWPAVMARFRAVLGRLAAGGPGLAAGWAPGGARLPSHA
jgi:glycosyltransferase involved in cell wall biosynthesis